MSKTHRHAPAPTADDPRGNPTPLYVRVTEEVDRALEDADLLNYAMHVAPTDWSAEVLKALGKRASLGPWRRHYGEGIADWGAVPGSQPGARRYYFGATRGRETMRGTVVANSARAVERWLRDQERADGYASRDPRHIAEP